VRAAHEEYGAALDITQPADQQTAVSLQDALAKQRDALAAYAQQIVAWGNQAEANEASARAALQPIDQARAEEAARASSTKTPSEPDVTPETPVPTVP
jgi:hypothetical protein